MATITTFTPQAAQQNLQNDGLSALGLASLLLAPRWDTTTPGGGAYDATNLTLTLSSPRAPFRAVREFTDGPSAYSGPDGAALSGSAAIVRLHPQAVQRLERLAAVRYALPGATPIRPVPWAMVVRGWAGTTTPQWYEADEALTGASNVQVSFHDGRGLIIDPIALAAMFADLLAAFPALQVPNAGGTLGGPGGLTGIAGLASGTLIHVIEPHGAVYQPAVPAATIITTDSGGNPSGTMPASGLIALATGQRIAGASGDSGRLRWGWAMNSTLARTPLVPPPSQGSYFQLVDYGAVSTLPEAEFCQWLTREVGVAAIPVSAFYDGGFEQRLARLCFAKRDETLAAALERLARLERLERAQ